MTTLSSLTDRTLDVLRRAFVPPGLSLLDRMRAGFLVPAACLGLVTALTLLPSVLPSLASGFNYRHAIISLAFVGGASVLWLVRTGRVWLAGHFCPSIALVTAGIMIAKEGLDTPRIGLVLIAIIMAGLLNRPAMAIAYAGLACATILGVYYLGETGYLVFSPLPGDAWVTSVRLTIVAGLLVALLASGLKKTIAQLQATLSEVEESRAGREAAEARLEQSRRLEALGRLAGGVAHDFNNLLTVMLGNAELAKLKDTKSEELLDEIVTAANRGSDLTRRLLVFGQQRPSGILRISVDKALREMERLLSRLLGEQITVNVDAACDDPFVAMDPTTLDQVITNLAVNAQQAMPDGGHLRITTRNVDAREALGDADVDRWIRLSISDTGVGMPARIADQIFEPFFKGRSSDTGVGLGLHTVDSLVGQVGGRVSVKSVEGEGTRFDCYLPCAGSVARTPAREAAIPLAPEGTGSALIVDDEGRVLATIGRAVRAFNWEAIEAGSEDEAVAAWHESGPFDLLLTDVILVDTTGPSVAGRLRELQPDLQVCYLSGYSGRVLERQPLDPDDAFLAKPFSAEEMLEVLTTARRRRLS